MSWLVDPTKKKKSKMKTQFKKSTKNEKSEKSVYLYSFFHLR